ncbi:uncharacterized protein LOC134672331 [Cydia fagiglandana]|uniref:uncharacterized protein LOC134672331 n=1 Tax=Cydia fagiglandana TaxID=1458189 RepID=UPI002FEE64D7
MADAFNRSSRTVRTPPPEGRPMKTDPIVPSPAHTAQPASVDVVSTSEIQGWLSSIEQCLNEICTIANEGKLNADQKLRINKISRNVAGGVSQLAVQYQAVKQQILVNNAHLKALSEQNNIREQIKELQLSLQVAPKIETKVSFADKVRTGNNSSVVPIKTNSIVIYPTEKDKSSEDTKKLVQDLIKPEALKLHVRGMRKTKNGGVIINTDRKDDLEKLKASQQLQKSGLKLEETTKRRPKIILLSVPSNITENEVFDCIYEQNIVDQHPNISRETFMSSIKLSHKSGKKDLATCNYILECSAEVRRTLIQQQRVFINWTSCPARDYTLLTRCYKCQLYGHSAKYCREAESTCSHCGLSGHTIKECTKLSEHPNCATCMRFKKPSDHKTGDEQCPAKKSAQIRHLNNIDYEGP